MLVIAYLEQTGWPARPRMFILCEQTADCGGIGIAAKTMEHNSA